MLVCLSARRRTRSLLLGELLVVLLDELAISARECAAQRLEHALALLRPHLAPFFARFGISGALQLADLARQEGDWGRVAELGDRAFALADNPNHATELLPFVEGYAMTNQWSKSEELTRQTLETNRFTGAMLCSLWQRVAANASSPDMATVEAMQTLTCN